MPPSDSSGPTLGDGAAAPSLVPCTAGRLCWAAPLPTGDDYTSVWAAADDDVWLGTVTGTLVHWNGATFETSYQAHGQVSDTVLSGTGPSDVTALFTIGGTCSAVHWDGAWSAHEAPSGAPCSYDGPVVATRPVVGCASGGFVTISEGGFIVTAQSGATQNWGRAASMVANGMAPADVFASCDPSGALVFWALRSDGHLASARPAKPPIENTLVWTDEVDLKGSFQGGGLWGTSGSDLWEVVDEVQEVNAVQATYVATTFRHYDGKQWTTVHREAAGGGGALPIAQGQAILGRGPADIFATDGNGNLWHYDGASWSTVTQAAGASLLPWSASVLSVSPSSVFVVGASGQFFQWSAAGLSKLAGGDPEVAIQQISVSAHDDVWAIRDQYGAMVQHFDGTSWQSLPDPAFVFPEYTWGAVTLLAALGPKDAWVVGTWSGAQNGSQLAHWDGTGWGYFDLPATATALWGDTASDVWVAVASLNTNGSAAAVQVLRWDGATLKAMDGTGLKAIDFTSCPISSISGVGPSEVWLQGGQVTDAGSCEPALVRWDGSQFHDVTPANIPFFPGQGVLATGPNDVWSYWQGDSVGGGSMLHFDGTNWSSWPAQNQFYAAWASGPNDVWFAGVSSSLSGGTASGRAALAHWDGQELSEDTTPPLGPGLYSISGAGPNDMWVGGAGGAILRTSLDAPPVSTH